MKHKRECLKEYPGHSLYFQYNESEWDLEMSGAKMLTNAYFHIDLFRLINELTDSTCDSNYDSIIVI